MSRHYGGQSKERRQFLYKIGITLMMIGFLFGKNTTTGIILIGFGLLFQAFDLFLDFLIFMMPPI